MPVIFVLIVMVLVSDLGQGTTSIKKISLLVNFRDPSFNNDHIHHLEPFYGRMLKLLLRKRSQIRILLPYPRGVMGVMGLVMQTKTILSTLVHSSLSCYAPSV